MPCLPGAGKTAALEGSRHRERREVSSASFLGAPCTLWSDGMADGEAAAGAGGTWRDWLIDLLVTLAEDGEGFSGKRPNCDAGWETLLGDALADHGITFAEAVGTAFGVDRDLRDRHLLTPNRGQVEGIGRLLRAIAVGADAPDLIGAADTPVTATRIEREAAARFREAISGLRGIRRIPLASVAGRWEAAAASRIHQPSVTMADILTLRSCAARLDASARREWTRSAISYLDALVIRRQPPL